MNYQNGKLEVRADSGRMEILEHLISLGYGNTKNEVAEYLLTRSLDDLLRAGVVPIIDGRTKDGINALNARQSPK